MRFTKKEDVAETMTTTETESKRIARSIKAQPVNSNLPFSTYEKTAAHLQMQIAIYRDESNWKQVYRLGLALISLVQETMKKHAEWREKEKRFERWTKEAEAVLGELEILKEEINWCAKRSIEESAVTAAVDATTRRRNAEEEEGTTTTSSSSTTPYSSMGRRMIRPPPVVGGGGGGGGKRRDETSDGDEANGKGVQSSPSPLATVPTPMGRKGEAVKSGKHALLSDELIADKVKGLDIGLSNSARGASDASNPSSGGGDTPRTTHNKTVNSLLDCDYVAFDDNDALKPSTPPPSTPPVPPLSETMVSGENQHPISYDYVPSAGSIEFRPSVVLQHAQKPPSSSVASLDHLKLDKRLERYGLKEFIVNGDGNCQFRAISDQLYGDQSHHASVRAVVVAQMRARPDRYAAFVESPSTTSIASGSQTYGWTDASPALRDGEDEANYAAYLRNMSKLGSWGDHVTLQAASDAYGLPFCVITSYRDNFVLEIQPEKLKATNAEKVLWISFWSEVHYNSLYEIGSSKFYTTS